MIVVRTNVVDSNHYDKDCNAFQSGSPYTTYKNHERFEWYLYSLTPKANEEGVDVDEWTADNEFSGKSGIGALLTCDRDYVHRVAGTLAEAVGSGSVSTVHVTFGSSVTAGQILQSGRLRLYSSDAVYEVIEYTARSFNASTHVCTFTIASGTTLTNSYTTSNTADIKESSYFEAELDIDNSDISIGKFVFNPTALSRKLKEELEDAAKEYIDAAGIELIVFQTVESVITILKTIKIPFRVYNTMGDPNEDAQIPATQEAGVLALVNTAIVYGFSIQLSTNKITWVDYAEDLDFQIYRWVRWRLKATDAEYGDPFPLIVGPQGTPGAIVTLGAATIPFVISESGGVWSISTGTLAADRSYIKFTKAQLGDIVDHCEFDLLSLAPDGNYHTVSSDTTLDPFWNAGGDCVFALKSGTWPAGSYQLKPRGIPGRDGMVYDRETVTGVTVTASATPKTHYYTAHSGDVLVLDWTAVNGKDATIWLKLTMPSPVVSIALPSDIMIWVDDFGNETVAPDMSTAGTYWLFIHKDASKIRANGKKVA